MSRKRKVILGVIGLMGVAVFLAAAYEGTRCWYVTQQLEKIGPAEAAWTPRLAEMLDDYNPWMRSLAARSLGRIGPGAKEARPALVAALTDGSAEVRIHAACALGHIGIEAPAAAALIEALGDANPEVRRYAAFALMRNPTFAHDAVPKLIEQLDDPHTADMAATALGEIGPPAKRSIPHILSALRRTQSLARENYAMALGKFGPDAAPALPDLREMALDADPDVRKAAATALLSIAPPP